MFDFLKPTTQMLGRWQPWHAGHTELFRRALAETGQVCIQIRTVPPDTDASGGRTVDQSDNPFSYDFVCDAIEDGLHDAGFTEHDLGKDVHEISATKIRAQLREEGKL